MPNFKIKYQNLKITNIKKQKYFKIEMTTLGLTKSKFLKSGYKTAGFNIGPLKFIDGSLSISVVVLG